MPVKHQNVALDYIGKRGSAINVGRRERVQYAREILQKEVSNEGYGRIGRKEREVIQR
jgi:RNA polymerase Rpb2, domain 2